MSNIVKHNELKRVINGLWDKIKDNFMTITKASQYVSKVKPNVISEKTVIVDGYIQGDKYVSVDNNPNQVNYMGTGGFFIYDGLSVRTDTKISHIVIGVNENLNVGDMVSDIKIGYAKMVNFPNIRIEKYVIENGISFVHENKDPNLTNCTKAITVEVNDTVTDDIMLIVGCKDAIWGAKDASTNGLASGGAPAPLVGEIRTLGYGNWVGKVVVYADKISLKDLANNVTTIRTELNNKVNTTEVGNGANQIPRINGNGRLEESIMPDIAITDVIVVPNISDLMTQNVQTGDVVVVQSIGNKTFMCKNPQGATQDTKFIEINMGYPVVKEINGLSPSSTGAITIDGADINATVGGNVNNVQQHLQKINGDVTTLDTAITTVRNDLSNTKVTVNTIDNRLTNVESKRHATQVGEIVSVLTTNSSDYTISGTTFLYLGTAKTVTSNTYPQLASAFGLTNVNSFNLPIINDVNVRYDNGARTITRKHFICAKKTQ